MYSRATITSAKALSFGFSCSAPSACRSCWKTPSRDISNKDNEAMDHNDNSTITVLKSHQAGKVTSSPCHSGDIEKSHLVVESHIREEGSPWHGQFHL